MSAPLWSYVTISLVVGYLNYRLGQVGNGNLLYVYFGIDWGTVLKIGLFGNMATLKYPANGGANQGAYNCTSYLIIIIIYLSHTYKHFFFFFFFFYLTILIHNK